MVHTKVFLDITYTSDVGTIHLELQPEGNGRTKTGTGTGALGEGMRGYWEGQGISLNPDGGYDLDIPVVSQDDDAGTFHVRDVLLASAPANPVQTFGDDYTITLHDSDGTLVGDQASIVIPIMIKNYLGEENVIKMNFTDTLNQVVSLIR